MVNMLHARCNALFLQIAEYFDWKNHRTQSLMHPSLDSVKPRPDWFINAFKACMVEGVFPVWWKRQKLVLLLKPSKRPRLLSSFRPIGLIDTTKKMLERAK